MLVRPCQGRELKRPPPSGNVPGAKCGKTSPSLSRGSHQYLYLQEVSCRYSLEVWTQDHPESLEEDFFFFLETNRTMTMQVS